MPSSTNATPGAIRDHGAIGVWRCGGYPRQCTPPLLHRHHSNAPPPACSNLKHKFIHSSPLATTVHRATMEGKVALVTGANTGIGLETARCAGRAPTLGEFQGSHPSSLSGTLREAGRWDWVLEELLRVWKGCWAPCGVVDLTTKERECRGLYRAGAHVVLACRNKGSAEKAMESIKASVVRADTPPPVADDKPQPRPTHLRFVGVC